MFHTTQISISYFFVLLLCVEFFFKRSLYLLWIVSISILELISLCSFADLETTSFISVLKYKNLNSELLLPKLGESYNQFYSYVLPKISICIYMTNSCTHITIHMKTAVITDKGRHNNKTTKTFSFYRGYIIQTVWSWSRLWKLSLLFSEN